MAHEGGYAPRSPDLSAFQPQASQEPPYQPGPFAYQPPPYSLNNQQPHPALGQPYLAPPQAQVYAPPIVPHPQYQPQHPPPVMTQYESSAPFDPEFVPQSAGGSSTGARRGRRPKRLKVDEEQQQSHRVQCDKLAPGKAEGIEVRTKFPVARIKRIMQADEDVGKVAQVTPTAVSKALELFMISLVTQSADMARGKNSKKVTASHLKQVIQQNSTFDFLSEIVAKVPDAPTSRKEHKEEDSEGEGKKRKGRAKRRAEEEVSS